MATRSAPANQELDLPVPFRGQQTHAHTHVWGSGGGAQILCLHGLASSAAESFAGLAARLAPSCELVAPDWLGFGLSTRLLGLGDDYGADYCSEWLLRFITAAQASGILARRFSILAVSMAGIAVAKCHARLRDSLDRVVLIAPAGLDAWVSRPFALGMAAPWLQRLPPVRRRLAAAAGHELLPAEMEVLRRYTRAGSSPWGRMRETHVLGHEFDRLENPVLLLSGDRDSVFPRRGYLEYAARRSSWRSVRIERGEHVLLGEHDEAVSTAIEEFNA